MAEGVTQTLKKMMIPVYLVTSLVLSATYATAVEPGARRSLRSNGAMQLHVTARPRIINFYPGQTIEIRCRSKGGYEVEDYPFISFYRQLDSGETGERTVFPLSSAYPGVSIEAQAATSSHSQRRRGKALKVLKLEPIAWHMLTNGQNLFYCRSSTINGETKLAYFFVRKMTGDE